MRFPVFISDMSVLQTTPTRPVAEGAYDRELAGEGSSIHTLLAAWPCARCDVTLLGEKKGYEKGEPEDAEKVDVVCT